MCSTRQKDTLPAQITQEFRDIYSTLYNLPNRRPALADIEDYIKTSLLPSLPTEFQEELAIGAMKPGRAPGPDSYTIL